MVVLGRLSGGFRSYCKAAVMGFGFVCVLVMVDWYGWWTDIAGVGWVVVVGVCGGRWFRWLVVVLGGEILI